MKNKLLFLLISIFAFGAFATFAAPPTKNPNPPRNFTANKVDNTTDIQLDWTDTSNNEDGFLIERSIDSAEFEQVASINADIETFTDSAIIEGAGIYEYRVYSYKLDNSNTFYSIYSDTVSVVVEIPNTPSDLAAATSSESIVLNWTDNSDNEDGFLIEKAFHVVNGQCLIPTIIAYLDANTTTYTDTSTTEAGAYTYRVAAYIGSTTLLVSDYSEPVTLQTENFVPEPGNAPSDLAVEKVAFLENLLTWTDNSTSEDGFEVERKENVFPHNTFEVIASGPSDGLGPDTLSFTDNVGISTGTSTPSIYYYRVRGYEKVGPEKIYSDYSNIAEVAR